MNRFGNVTDEEYNELLKMWNPPETREDLYKDLTRALENAREMRDAVRLLEDYAGASVWRWQGDGMDKLESMGNRMSVLIHAGDLRNLIKSNVDVDSIRNILDVVKDDTVWVFGDYSCGQLVRGVVDYMCSQIIVEIEKKYGRD